MGVRIYRWCEDREKKKNGILVDGDQMKARSSLERAVSINPRQHKNAVLLEFLLWERYSGREILPSGPVCKQKGWMVVLGQVARSSTASRHVCWTVRRLPGQPTLPDNTRRRWRVGVYRSFNPSKRLGPPCLSQSITFALFNCFLRFSALPATTTTIATVLAVAASATPILVQSSQSPSDYWIIRFCCEISSFIAFASSSLTFWIPATFRTVVPVHGPWLRIWRLWRFSSLTVPSISFSERALYTTSIAVFH